MRVKKRLALAILSTCFVHGVANTAPVEVNLKKDTVEEQRIGKANSAIPHALSTHQARIAELKEQLDKARNYTASMQLVIRHAPALWEESVHSFNTQGDYDDRPLYWSRLKMKSILRKAPAFAELLPDQQEALLWAFELYSRGQRDVKFDKNADIKVLLTGFDPFHLDKSIRQSNPSGVAAHEFDDLFLSIDGKKIEIETLIFPVRFEDFDKGMVEELLTPYYRNTKVDMVFTVSMGREDFDLERFPGLRRSSFAPDNLNVHTGAKPENPLVPKLNGKPLNGPEFMQFSLPAKAMLEVQTPFKVNDNHKVTTLNKTFYPKRLSELNGEISVRGSGGGYLSNEISYRSLLLREQYNPLMVVGHIHTPKFVGFEPEKSEKIVKQIKNMVIKAAGSLN